MSAPRYQHSGRFTPQSVGFVPIAVLAMVPLAFAYAAVDMYSPCVGITTVVAVAAYAFGAGFVGGYALKAGQTRNRLVAGVLAAAIGFGALWASWIAFLAVFVLRLEAEVPLWSLLLPPVDWAMIAAINQDGWFTIKGSSPSGGLLWLIWAAEAVAIVGGAGFTAYTMVDTPYCEPCGRWTAKRPFTSGVRPSSGLVDAIEGGNADEVGRVPLATAGTDVFERLDVMACPACSRTRTLSVSAVRMSKDSKGRDKEESTVLLAHALVDEAFLERVLAGHDRQRAPG